MVSPWAIALTAAAIGAGVAGLSIDIKNAVEGTLPWQRTPEQFGKDFLGVAASAGLSGVGALAGAGLGAAGGALFGGAGETVGATAPTAAGEIAAGVTSNAGTIPAQAGAASTASAVEAGIPAASGVTEALNTAKSTFGASGFADKLYSTLGDSAAQGLVGAAGGAARNPEDPLRGALVGATSGAVSGAAGSALRGVVPVRTAPSLTMAQYTPTDTNLASNFTTSYTPMPSTGQMLAARGLSAGSSFLGKGAGLGVAAATAPPPPVPPDPSQYQLFPAYTNPGPSYYRPLGRFGY